MREESSLSGGHLLRWIFVVPAFFISYIFLGVIIKYVVDSLIGIFFTGGSYQAQFIVQHLYDDLFCVAFSIYFSCVTAPSRRMLIAIFYLFIVLVTIPKHLETAHRMGFYGDFAWKEPYLITLYILSGLIPVLFMLYINYEERKNKSGETEEDVKRSIL